MTKAAEVILRVMLGLMFIFAGALKVLEPDQFLQDILAFNIAPYPIAYIGAFALPWLEILAGLGLIARRVYAASAAAGAAMMAIFIPALLYADMRGDVGLDCGCFGSWLVFPSFESHIVFNAVCLAALIWLIIKEARKKA